MQPAQLPANAPSVWAELASRSLLALFMFLCFRLTAIILAPVQQGDLKLVIVSLVEVAMMVVLALYFGRSRVGRDINEFNCYALLVHLVYLPAFYSGIPASYHNEAIKLLLVLVVARLLYFGPRTADGDFAGLPVFGLLGHLQSTMAKRQPASGQWLRHLPSVLFFGAALPLWLIIARTNDPVITATAIGLMAFIFVMAMKMQREKEAALRTARAGAAEPCVSEPAPVRDPGSLPAPVRAQPPFIPGTSPVANDTAAHTAKQAPTQAAVAAEPAAIVSAHAMASLVVTAFNASHPSIQPLLAAANIHLAQAFPLHPPALGSNLQQRRLDVLDALNGLMLIGKQVAQKKADIDSEVLSRLGVAFSQVFADQIEDASIKKYLDLVQEKKGLELGDTELFLASELLTVVWLRTILNEGYEYLGGLDELTRLTMGFIEKYWPEDGSGAED